MAALPTGTVTFLFTDIEGSTTLLQRLGDRRYAEVLEEHRRLLRAAFAEGNGREVNRQGDSFLVAFSRARDAVGAGVAAQLALTTLNDEWELAVSLDSLATLSGVGVMTSARWSCSRRAWRCAENWGIDGGLRPSWINWGTLRNHWIVMSWRPKHLARRTLFARV